MLSLLCAFSLPSNPASITVWEPAIKVRDLAAKLSAADMSFTADHAVAQRRAAVFAEGRPREEVAQRVASCLGMKLRREGNGYRFVADPVLTNAFRNHEANVDQEIRKALLRVAQDFRRNPPYEARHHSPGDSKRTTYRPYASPSRPETTFADRKQAELDRWFAFSRRSSEVATPWLLARANKAELARLVDGHCLTASIPAQNDGSIGLPGTPDDYPTLQGLKQVYLVAQIDPWEHNLRIRYFTPQDDLRGSDTWFTLLSLGGSVYSYGAAWTNLGEVARQWQSNGYPTPDLYPGQGLGSQVSQPFGTWLEKAAKKSGRPVVAIASPRAFPVDFTTLGAARREGGWLQFWPPFFWRAEEEFAEAERPLPNPDLEKPVAVLDAAIAYVEGSHPHLTSLAPETPLRARRHGLHQRAELRFEGPFIALWRVLSPAEKRAALEGEGLAWFRLTPAKRAFFEDALLNFAHRSSPQGDITELVSPQKRPALRLRLSVLPRLYLAGESGSSTSDWTIGEQVTRLNPGKTPFESLQVKVTFHSRHASTQQEFHVLRPYGL